MEFDFGVGKDEQALTVMRDKGGDKGEGDIDELRA